MSAILLSWSLLAAPADGDGAVTLGEAFDHTRDVLTTTIHDRSQVPSLRGGRRDLVLARGAHERAPDVGAILSTGDVAVRAAVIVGKPGKPEPRSRALRALLALPHPSLAAAFLRAFPRPTDDPRVAAAAAVQRDVRPIDLAGPRTLAVELEPAPLRGVSYERLPAAVQGALASLGDAEHERDAAVAQAVAALDKHYRASSDVREAGRAAWTPAEREAAEARLDAEQRRLLTARNKKLDPLDAAVTRARDAALAALARQPSAEALWWTALLHIEADEARSAALQRAAEVDEPHSFSLYHGDEALAALKRLVVEHPKWPQHDEALYRLAQRSRDRFDDDGEARALEGLARMSDSPLAAEATLRLAAMAYAGRRLLVRDFERCNERREAPEAVQGLCAVGLAAARWRYGTPAEASVALVDALGTAGLPYDYYEELADLLAYAALATATLDKSTGRFDFVSAVGAVAKRVDEQARRHLLLKATLLVGRTGELSQAAALAERLAANRDFGASFDRLERRALVAGYWHAAGDAKRADAAVKQLRAVEPRVGGEQLRAWALLPNAELKQQLAARLPSRAGLLRAGFEDLVRACIENAAGPASGELTAQVSFDPGGRARAVTSSGGDDATRACVEAIGRGLEVGEAPPAATLRVTASFARSTDAGTQPRARTVEASWQS